MTLHRQDLQEVECDVCQKREVCPSGHARPGWYLITNHDDYRRDFCSDRCLTDAVLP